MLPRIASLAAIICGLPGLALANMTTVYVPAINAGAGAVLNSGEGVASPAVLDTFSPYPLIVLAGFGALTLLLGGGAIWAATRG